MIRAFCVLKGGTEGRHPSLSPPSQHPEFLLQQASSFPTRLCNAVHSPEVSDEMALLRRRYKGGISCKLYHIGGGYNTLSGASPASFSQMVYHRCFNSLSYVLSRYFDSFRLVKVRKGTSTIHSRGLVIPVNYCIVSLALEFLGMVCGSMLMLYVREGCQLRPTAYRLMALQGWRSASLCYVFLQYNPSSKHNPRCSRHHGHTISCFCIIICMYFNVLLELGLPVWILPRCVTARAVLAASPA